MTTLNNLPEEYKKAVEELSDTLEKNKTIRVQGLPAYFQNKGTVEDELLRRKKIDNDAAEQDSKMKKLTLLTLFIFLAAETVAIFVLAVFQAIEAPWGFKLEEWSFRLLLGATITQITLMLNTAVKHLFPHRRTRK